MLIYNLNKPPVPFQSIFSKPKDIKAGINIDLNQQYIRAYCSSIPVNNENLPDLLKVRSYGQRTQVETLFHKNTHLFPISALQCPPKTECQVWNRKKNKKNDKTVKEDFKNYFQTYPVSNWAMQRGVILLRPSAVRVSTCFFKRFCWEIHFIIISDKWEMLF